jgi:hypothetical protein
MEVADVHHVDFSGSHLLRVSAVPLMWQIASKFWQAPTRRQRRICSSVRASLERKQQTEILSRFIREKTKMVKDHNVKNRRKVSPRRLRKVCYLMSYLNSDPASRNVYISSDR